MGDAGQIGDARRADQVDRARIPDERQPGGVCKREPNRRVKAGAQFASRVRRCDLRCPLLLSKSLFGVEGGECSSVLLDPLDGGLFGGQAAAFAGSHLLVWFDVADLFDRA